MNFFKKTITQTQQFACPYCGKELPAPTRKRACPNCKKIIYARTRPNGEKNWIKEEDLVGIEKEWELDVQKQIFIREASEIYYTAIYNQFDKLIAQSKQAFKQGKSDEAWKLDNMAILKAGEKFDDTNWADRFRTIYFVMACQLSVEERYKEAVTLFAKVIYWACLEQMIREINYQQADNYLDDKTKQRVIELSLDMGRALPPFILEPIITALYFANTRFEEFRDIFLKENLRDQQLALKLIPIHEKSKFNPPSPESIWNIVSNIVKDNLEIRGSRFAQSI